MPERPCSRAEIFRLLAIGYYEPEQDFLLQESYPEQLATAAHALSPEASRLAADLAVHLDAATQGELLLDYARLFVGPQALLAPPYGSVYLDSEKRLMGASTLAIRQIYAQQGFALAADFHEMPDHVAVELEFLYLLETRATAANQDNDAQLLATITAIQQDFLTRHLGRWVSEFTEGVRANADTGFYRCLAALTEHAVLHLVEDA